MGQGYAMSTITFCFSRFKENEKHGFPLTGQRKIEKIYKRDMDFIKTSAAKTKLIDN